MTLCSERITTSLLTLGRAIQQAVVQGADNRRTSGTHFEMIERSAPHLSHAMLPFWGLLTLSGVSRHMRRRRDAKAELSGIVP